MRKVLIIGLLALALAPVAQADHGNGLFWPTTSYALNEQDNPPPEGSCANPPGQCRWVHIIDRTGFSASTYYNGNLVAALNKFKWVSGDRILFTRVSMGSRFDLCDTADVDALHALTPLGAISIGRNVCGPNGPDSVSCDNPAYPEFMVQPYCGASGAGKVADGVIAVGSNPMAVTLHELGHLFGLGDRATGSTVMRSTSFSGFDSHDQAVMDAWLDITQ